MRDEHLDYIYARLNQAFTDPWTPQARRALFGESRLAIQQAILSKQIRAEPFFQKSIHLKAEPISSAMLRRIGDRLDHAFDPVPYGSVPYSFSDEWHPNELGYSHTITLNPVSLDFPPEPPRRYLPWSVNARRRLFGESQRASKKVTRPHPYPLDVRITPEEPVVLKSETCACYRDDDGLHPCAVGENFAVHGPTYEYLAHLQGAFNLNITPAPPKRARKLPSGYWEAPCGCEISFHEGPGRESVHCWGGSCSVTSVYDAADHFVRAAAAVMREQTPPMPTDEEITKAYYSECSRVGIGTVTQLLQSFKLGAKWARKP